MLPITSLTSFKILVYLIRNLDLLKNKSDLLKHEAVHALPLLKNLQRTALP